MVQRCQTCYDNYKYCGATLKRCSGCKKVYYCSTDCQNSDWIYHIFDCKPHRVNTANHLARAVYDDLVPEHPQTCEDYGFDCAVTAEEKSNLIGLYIGLIKIMKIPPKTIHDWRTHGVLVDKIKAAYYKAPEGSRGLYFPWFLQNEHIIARAGQHLPRETLYDHHDAAVVRAWRFTGGSERDSVEDIRVAIAAKPVEDQNCLSLYTLLLSKLHPSPALDLWVDFGFASCRSQEEELQLGAQYRKLITMCTFKEFYDAYHTHYLLDLFHSKGLQVNNNDHLRDLLRSDKKKSVWHLKKAVVQEDSTNERSKMTPTVMVDYGFNNCINDSERRQLVRAYKVFFDSRNGDPLALHEAARKGKTYSYFSTVIQNPQDPNLQRLMENPYHIPGFETVFLHS